MSDAGEGTVVTISSYEARAYGVKTGMTVYKAKRLYPWITLVVGNYHKYAEICAQPLRGIRFTPDTVLDGKIRRGYPWMSWGLITSDALEICCGHKATVKSRLGHAQK